MAGLLAPAASIFAAGAEEQNAPWKAWEDFKGMSNTKKAVYGTTSGLLICFAISLYSLLYNEPKVHFESKGKWKDLLNPKLLFKDPKKYFQNIRNVYWTKLIGQIYKDNELKLNSEGKAKMSRKKLPAGFMGNAYTHYYVLKKTSGVVGDFAKIVTPIFALCFMADRLGLIGFKKKADAPAAEPITDERIVEIVARVDAARAGAPADTV